MVFFWIAAYGLVYTLACALPQQVRLWAVPLGIVGYAAILIGWIFRSGQARALGLCAPPGKPGRGLWLVLPMLLLPLCNLLLAGSFHPEPSTLVLMLGVCTVEEVFFRGFLLRRLLRFGAIAAILLSGGIFALFHLASPAEALTDPSAQLACAFAVGICYGAAALRLGSLIPCILSHFLTNITAAPLTAEAVPWLWLCTAVYLCIDVFLCKRVMVITHKEDSDL